MRLYWLNAICTNQDAIPEMDQQVSQMDEIYARAQKVLVWLGNNPHTERCFRMLAQITAPDALRLENKDQSLLQYNACNGIPDLAYWQRAGIVQGIALAKEVWLKCSSII